jgi:polysaccharide biosynthesis protein PslF
MRIALLTGEYPPQPGGVGDYSQRLGQALLERGHQVFVFTIDDARFTIHDLDNTNRNSEMVHSASTWGWGMWRDTIAALGRIGPDVLHIQYQTGAYNMRPAVNLLPWRLRGLPSRPALVVTAHDLLLPYLFPKAGPLRGWVTRRILHDADAVVVTNAADFAQLADKQQTAHGEVATNITGHRRSTIVDRRSSIRRLKLIPIGSNIPVAPPDDFERERWRARLGIQPTQTLLAYFGLSSRNKGLDTLLRALARLPEDVRLLVIGGAATAPEDRAFATEVDRLIGELGLTQRLTITGQCPAREASAHLLAADIAALPFVDGASFRRGSLLAALAHGLPTVTTSSVEPRAESRELPEPHSVLDSRFSLLDLADGENVLLVPPADHVALAGAIERLAGDTALRATLAAGGRALAGHFSWQEIALRHEQIYQMLAAAEAATRASHRAS